MLAIQRKRVKKPRAKKPRIAIQHFKGQIDGKDFTAKVFSITKSAGRWTLSGSMVDDDNVTHKLQLVFPVTYLKGLYNLEHHRENIRLSYSTDNLSDPILRYGHSGLISLDTVDLNNTHVAGALRDIVTAPDGNPISTIDALFSLG